jgi:hypothetical protein
MAVDLAKLTQADTNAQFVYTPTGETVRLVSWNSIAMFVVFDGTTAGITNVNPADCTAK